MGLIQLLDVVRLGEGDDKDYCPWEKEELYPQNLFIFSFQRPPFP